jgi:hypothetical protein
MHNTTVPLWIIVVELLHFILIGLSLTVNYTQALRVSKSVLRSRLFRTISHTPVQRWLLPAPAGVIVTTLRCPSSSGLQIILLRRTDLTLYTYIDVGLIWCTIQLSLHSQSTHRPTHSRTELRWQCPAFYVDCPSSRTFYTYLPIDCSPVFYSSTELPGVGWKEGSKS